MLIGGEESIGQFLLRTQDQDIQSPEINQNESMEVKELTTSVREISMRINERVDTVPVKEEHHIQH